MHNKMLFILILILSASISYSQNKRPVIEPDNLTVKAPVVETDVEDQLSLPGQLRNSIKIWGGYSNFLYTYKDYRYVGNDKGDYINTGAYHSGIEMIFADFSDYDPMFKDFRAGFNINTMYKERVKQRTLYAVTAGPVILPEEKFPADNNQDEKVWQVNLIPGGFIGMDKKWWGADFGLGIDVNAIDEEFRERRDASGNVYNSKGRGLVWGGIGVFMNFYGRLGREDRGYFEFSFNRMDYNPLYGTLQYNIALPVSTFFMMKIGGYLYGDNQQISAIFLEPVIKFSDMEIGLKAGTVINYHDSNIEKIAITDSLFYGISYLYKW